MQVTCGKPGCALSRRIMDGMAAFLIAADKVRLRMTHLFCVLEGQKYLGR